MTLKEFSQYLVANHFNLFTNPLAMEVNMKDLLEQAERLYKTIDRLIPETEEQQQQQQQQEKPLRLKKAPRQ